MPKLQRLRSITFREPSDALKIGGMICLKEVEWLDKDFLYHVQSRGQSTRSSVYVFESLNPFQFTFLPCHNRSLNTWNMGERKKLSSFPSRPMVNQVDPGYSPRRALEFCHLYVGTHSNPALQSSSLPFLLNYQTSSPPWDLNKQTNHVLPNFS